MALCGTAELRGQRPDRSGLSARRTGPRCCPHWASTLRGDADLKALVDRIHQEDFRAQLWWSPLSAVLNSELLKDHPDYELQNREGSKRKVSWGNSNYLCSADHRVVEYHRALSEEDSRGLGFRWPEAGWTGYERCSSLLNFNLTHITLLRAKTSIAGAAVLHVGPVRYYQATTLLS